MPLAKATGVLHSVVTMLRKSGSTAQVAIVNKVLSEIIKSSAMNRVAETVVEELIAKGKNSVLTWQQEIDLYAQKLAKGRKEKIPTEEDYARATEAVLQKKLEDVGLSKSEVEKLLQQGKGELGYDVEPFVINTTRMLAELAYKEDSGKDIPYKIYGETGYKPTESAYEKEATYSPYQTLYYLRESAYTPEEPYAPYTFEKPYMAEKPYETEKPYKPEKPYNPEKPYEPPPEKGYKPYKPYEPPPPEITTSKGGGWRIDEREAEVRRREVPAGSIAWKQGELKVKRKIRPVWKYIPPPWTQSKPINLFNPPKGAKNTHLRTPAETIQMIGEPGAQVPKSVSVDLGIADIFIDNYGKEIRFKGGEKRQSLALAVLLKGCL